MKIAVIPAIIMIVGIMAGVFSYDHFFSKGNKSNHQSMVTALNPDSIRTVIFKKEMGKTNSFLRLVSRGKYDLDDTLWIKNSEGKTGIWIREFWGTKREALYEIGIGDNLGESKIVVVPISKSSDEEVKLLIKPEGRGPHPGSEEFFYCFRGLLKTFCKQEGYELP